MNSPEGGALGSSRGALRPATPNSARSHIPGSVEAKNSAKKAELAAKVQAERQNKDRVKKYREQSALNAEKEREADRESRKRANECRREAAKLKAVLEEQRLLEKRIRAQGLPAGNKIKGARWEAEQVKKIRTLQEKANAILAGTPSQEKTTKTLGYTPRPASLAVLEDYEVDAKPPKKKGTWRKLLVFAVVLAGGLFYVEQDKKRKKRERALARRRAEWRATMQR